MASTPSKEALIILLVCWAPFVWPAEIECSSVDRAFSACAGRWAEPSPWSPCCGAMSGLSFMAKSSRYEKQATCRCVMGLITSFSPSFSPIIASLPGFCGISLGFTIQPGVDCDSII